MSKKLVLINPVSRAEDLAKLTEAPWNQPLGLGIVAALTPKDWEIEILDENAKPFEYADADLVGITAFTQSINRGYHIAGQYRERGVPVVIGGVHASMNANEALQFVDTVVTGEAESVWGTVISDFEKGNMQRIYHGKMQDLSLSPKPRRDLFHPDCSNAAIQTTRGCPMNCSFCSVTAFNGNRFRKRAIEVVLDELETIPQNFVAFLDDNLVGYGKIDEEYAISLFKGMIERGINKIWRCNASMNFCTNERLLEYAAKSGCRMVFLGVESDDIDALKEMNKRVNLKIGVTNYEDLFLKVQQHGIAIETNFIYGMDADTPEKLRRRTEYILESGIDVAYLSLLTPLPGTKLFNKLKDQGRLLHSNYPDDWWHHNFFTVSHRPALIEPEQLEEIFRESFNLIHDPLTLKRRSDRTFKTTNDLTLALMALKTNLFIKGNFDTFSL